MKKFIIAISITGIIILILGMYALFNFNRFKTYEFSGKSDNLTINGIINLNPVKNSLIIKDVFTNGVNAIEARYIHLEIYYLDKNNEEKLIVGTGNIKPQEKHQNVTFELELLDEYLKNLNIYLEENDGYDEYFSSYFKKNIDEGFFYKVYYTTEDDIDHEEIVELKIVNKYSNNSFFYKKAKHI